MPVQLENIKPEFRQLTDLLFFSDRMDLDLSKFKSLLKENYIEHFEYVWSRFSRASEIFWLDGSKFWAHRLAFLLDLNEKALTKRLEEHLEKRMFNLVKTKFILDIQHDIEYLQFIELCKIKHNRKEDLSHIKQYLTEMPDHVATDKLIAIVNSFIPIVFRNIDEYAEAVANKITRSDRHFKLLLELERHGWPLNRKPIVKLVKELILYREHSDKNCRSFFYIINDIKVMSEIKKEYCSEWRSHLVDIIDVSEFRLLEEGHMINIKNLLDIDPSLSEEIIKSYGDKLYQRKAGHKKANADRLIRLIKNFPQIGAKKVLAYLSAKNKMVDIKYILTSFPDLKKLAAFV